MYHGGDKEVLPTLLGDYRFEDPHELDFNSVANTTTDDDDDASMCRYIHLRRENPNPGANLRISFAELQIYDANNVQVNYSVADGATFSWSWGTEG